MGSQHPMANLPAEETAAKLEKDQPTTGRLWASASCPPSHTPSSLLGPQICSLWPHLTGLPAHFHCGILEKKSRGVRGRLEEKPGGKGWRWALVWLQGFPPASPSPGERQTGDSSLAPPGTTGPIVLPFIQLGPFSVRGSSSQPGPAPCRDSAFGREGQWAVSRNREKEGGVLTKKANLASGVSCPCQRLEKRRSNPDVPNTGLSSGSLASGSSAHPCLT